MAAIQDLVLTFCPKTCCVPQRKLKLLMPVLKCISVSFQWKLKFDKTMPMLQENNNNYWFTVCMSPLSHVPT